MTCELYEEHENVVFKDELEFDLCSIVQPIFEVIPNQCDMVVDELKKNVDLMF